MGNGKLKKFFKNNKIGKSLISVGLGALSATPVAPFLPSIKGAVDGLAGEDKHDGVAWISFAITLAVIVGFIYLTMQGETEAANNLLEIAE